MRDVKREGNPKSQQATLITFHVSRLTFEHCGNELTKGRFIQSAAKITEDRADFRINQQVLKTLLGQPSPTQRLMPGLEPLRPFRRPRLATCYPHDAGTPHPPRHCPGPSP